MSTAEVCLTTQTGPSHPHPGVGGVSTPRRPNATVGGGFRAWLYRWVPAWSRLFWPWRMTPFVFMSLAPLVLAGLRRFRRPALVFTGLFLVELALRGTLFLSAAPVVAAPFYQIPGPQEGIVELSYPWNSSMACYCQAFHGRPTLGTVSQAWPHYGPPPDSLLADPLRYHEEPFLAWLEQVREGPAGPAPPADFLVRLGYIWVVVHTDWPGGHELVQRLRVALGPWHHRDSQVVAWKLSLSRDDASRGATEAIFTQAAPCRTLSADSEKKRGEELCLRCGAISHGTPRRPARR